MPDDMVWTGKDVYGNDYCSYTDKSPNDFWIQTIIKKDKRENYTVLSCDIIPKAEEDKNAS